MTFLDRITTILDVCNGKPTIEVMRITVKAILEYITTGKTIEGILKE